MNRFGDVGFVVSVVDVRGLVGSKAYVVTLIMNGELDVHTLHGETEGKTWSVVFEAR